MLKNEMSLHYNCSIRIACFFVFFLLSGSVPAQQTLIPDSLLHKEWDVSEIQYRSLQPWTEGCDSIFEHPFYPGITFYYNVDSFCHLIATRPLHEITEEVYYFYYMIDLLNDKRKNGPVFREKMQKAARQYKSKALERELDVFDTYCYLIRQDMERPWSYFWRLVEKYERKGDPQTKLRIMERLLYSVSGFPSIHVSSEIEKEEIPVIRLINEILATLERMDEPYVIEPGHFYSYIGIIYYDFKYYNRAIPLLWKAVGQPIGHYRDRSVMKARDYLGDYYSMTGNYDRSDSLYMSILKDPEKVFMRPIDYTIAIGALAANAKLRGQPEEAIRLYSVAMPRALATRDSTLAAGYALHLGRLYLDKGETDKTGDLIEIARQFLLAGRLLIRNWERFYTLSRDYNLTINQAGKAARYIDSISMIINQREHIYNTRMLAYAEHEAFESERVLKEEQLNKQRSRLLLISIVLMLSLLLLIISLWFNRKFRAKNRDLFLRIKEQGFASSMLLRDVSRFGGTEESDPDLHKRELFVRVHHYLQTDGNFTKKDLDINTIINELSTNRTYLFETIKYYTGKTLQEYINTLRMEEAKLLLENTDEVIETIALLCGYNSERTFYRLFRTTYNMTPAVYRRIAKEEKKHADVNKSVSQYEE